MEVLGHMRFFNSKKLSFPPLSCPRNFFNDRKIDFHIFPMYRKSVPIKRTNSYAHTTHRTKVSAEKLKFPPATYGFKITMFISY